MKKIYYRPVISFVNIDTEIIAVSLSYTDEEASTDCEVLGNERRGEWNDLWK